MSRCTDSQIINGQQSTCERARDWRVLGRSVREAAALRHPLANECGHLASNVEASVVVHEGKLMRTGNCCGEPIGDPDQR